MIIYLLLITLLIEFSIAYYFLNQEIMHPAVIVCCVFVFSTICAIYNIDSWNIDLHMNTYFTIIGGVAVFIFFAMVAEKFKIIIFKKNSMTLNEAIVPKKNFRESNFIHVKYYKTFLTIAIGFVTIIWHFIWVKNVASQNGGIGNLSDIMYNFRMASSYDVLDSSLDKPFLLGKIGTITMIMGYFYLYIFIYNKLENIKFKKNVLNIFPVIFLCIDNILEAARGGLLNLIASALIIYYFLWQRKNGLKKKNNFKFMLKILLLLVLVLLAFSSLREIVGRTNDSSAINYITVYAGGSIQLLDMFLQDPHITSTLWGKETFYHVYEYIGNKFGISDFVYIAHLEFRQSNGVGIGNVYTALRSYIYDFGYLGMVVLVAICSLFYTKFYKKIKDKLRINETKLDFRILIYSYIAPALFMFSIAERAYSTIIFPGNITILIMALIIKYFLLDINRAS